MYNPKLISEKLHDLHVAKHTNLVVLGSFQGSARQGPGCENIHVHAHVNQLVSRVSNRLYYVHGQLSDVLCTHYSDHAYSVLQEKRSKGKDRSMD